jgi:hypothetical protein
MNILTIERVEPFADGGSIGKAGPLERVFGRFRGALDPDEPRNQGIVNLQKAPRNDAGKVEYEADVFMLRPADPFKRNHKVLYEFTNRGNKLFLPWVNGAPESTPVANNDPATLKDLGTAFLLRDGWTIVWSGWDATALKRPASLGIRVPFATDQGRTIVRRIREEFVFAGPLAPTLLEFPLTYHVADRDQQHARLTMRHRQFDPPLEIPQDQWTFAGERAVRLLPKGMEFSDTAIYDFWYSAKDPLVLGVGFAAVRDLLSCLRYEQEEPVRALMGLGISVAGRFIQELLSLGMNTDLVGRRLLDGALVYIAGSGRTFLNFEFGQPARTRNQHRDYNFPESWFPFSMAATSDPASGRESSLLDNEPSAPKIMLGNNSSEYWHKGASLVHTDPTGKRDLVLPDNVRAYMIAGTQHDAVPSRQQGRGPCVCERNPHSPAPVLRALLAALDAWVCEGRLPPESEVPTLNANTLVTPQALAFPVVPEVVAPKAANGVVPPFDWIDPPDRQPTPYPSLVCQVDACGNELAGIRTPDIAVPIGTYTGWNFYESAEARGELFNQTGAYIPLRLTRAQAAVQGDSRPALEDLYESHTAYIERVRSAVEQLIRQRFLLPEDGQDYIRRATQLAWPLDR